MGQQSVAKTVFLLVSMAGWLIVGAALMYLFPWMADVIISSNLTHRWMDTLSRGNYSPIGGLLIGGLALTLTTIGNLAWYRYFDSYSDSRRKHQKTP